jgi:YD repeat-containing protein
MRTSLRSCARRFGRLLSAARIGSGRRVYTLTSLVACACGALVTLALVPASASAAVTTLQPGSGDALHDGATKPPISLASPGGPTGRVVPRYTTANSVTYELPNGHMLTRVLALPHKEGATGGRDSARRLAPLSGASSDAVLPSALLAVQGSGSGQDELACTIDSSAPTSSECNASTLRAGSETSKPARSVHSLLQFALPNLHNNVTVLNARLELYETASSASTNVTMSAFRVLTPWSQGVTWNSTNGTTPWETPGGDYKRGNNPDSVPSQVGTSKGWQYWYPTAIVQKWLNGTAAPRGEGQPNLGLLIGEEIDGEVNNIVTFAGRGQAKGPGLTFEWVTRGIGTQSSYTMLPVQTGSTSTTLTVNAASGNLLAKSTDLHIASKAEPFEVGRVFNSFAPERFGYGDGWTDVNTPYIEVNADGSVAYTDNTGNTFVFDREGFLNGKPAGLRTPPGIEAVLCDKTIKTTPCPAKLPKGATYELLYTNAATEEIIMFKGSKGTIYPLAIEYASKELDTPNYSSGLVLPTSWTDSSGLPINYTESKANGYTKAVFEAEGESVSYVVAPDGSGDPKVVEYTNEQGQLTRYSYGVGAEDGLLTKIVEPGGATVSISYDAEDRVKKVEGPGSGQSTTYTYYELGSAPEPCTTAQKALVVTEEEGEEAPPKTYCSNVLDEVESVSGNSPTGQPGWYGLDENEPGVGNELASVNVATGNLLVKAEDVASEAANQYVGLSRYYNSQSGGASGTLGPRWQWGTGPSVYLIDEGATITVRGPSGYSIVLTRTPEGTYTAPEEYEGHLTKNANGTYTLTEQNGPTDDFNNHGVLVSETTEQGTATVTDGTLSGLQVLQQLVAGTGGVLEVKYNATPQVTQVVDAAHHSTTYEYNPSHQLTKVTAPSGAKTEYAYSALGLLEKITTPHEVETITTSGGRVNEITTKPTGRGVTDVITFTYQAAMSGTCNPPTDVGQTVVTSTVSGTETLCHNAKGEITGPVPATEEYAEEYAGFGEPPEEPNETCSELAEVPAEDCVEEEVPPEEGGEPLAATSAASAPAPPGKVAYGISDNNEIMHGFNYLGNEAFLTLGVEQFRRIVAWNVVSEAARAGESPPQSEARTRLADIEAWVNEVKKLHGVPMISFDHCPSGTTWYNVETKETESCLKPPTYNDYKKAMEAVFANATLKQVKRFTAWNEPNNQAMNPTNESQRVEPTWNTPKLAGEYWRALYSLCKPTVHKCEVAAGDFIDGSMEDAFKVNYVNKEHHSEPSKAHKYFTEYYAGMGRPKTVARWAWHSYAEGKIIANKSNVRHNHKLWWMAFKNLLAEVHKVTHNTNTELWLTEQGIVYSYGSEIGAKGEQIVPKREELVGTEYRAGNAAFANLELRAYVASGVHQITRVPGSQVRQFYYYSSRGSRNEAGAQDSGLLEVAPAKAGFTLPYGLAESAPRSIYNIYKAKVPRGP